MPEMFWNRKKAHQPEDMIVGPKAYISGHQFTIKGSPRFYTDVHRIITEGADSVYFGEPLTYERGAAVALWRIRANAPVKSDSPYTGRTKAGPPANFKNP